MTEQSVHPEADLERPQDTPSIVDIAAGRRAFIRSLGLGGTGAVAIGTASSLSTPAAAQAITDVDIANFALNLEYLEAQFYSFASFGHGLDPKLLTDGHGNPGGPIVPGNQRMVPFSSPLVRAYAQEIALDEMDHVKLFRTAAGVAAVGQPALNIGSSFTTAARAASIIGPHQTFDAYANDRNFLFAAYIFEDVGVTAFNGAAPLIQNKGILLAAAGVLAVEAYHAGLIRTVLFSDGARQRGGVNFKTTAGISNLRRALSGANDDQGIGPDQSTLAGGMRTPSNVVPTDANGLAFARTPRQVLNIVYGAPNASSGLFFPNGLNGKLR